MGGVVAMLDARQAKEESAVRPPFEVYEWGATFSNSLPEQIQGFTTEGEAARWIRNESAVCLHARRRDEAAS
jgi:hypothetical protein